MEVNHEEAKEWAVLFNAWGDKKPMQWLHPPSGTWSTVCCFPMQGTPLSCYRIKPEPYEKWVVIAPGDTIITVHDKQRHAVEDAAERNKGLAGDSYRVILMREVVLPPKAFL